MNKDLFGLGQILAKIFTFGKFSFIMYNKIKKNYEIFCNIKGMEVIHMEESKFWKMLKDSDNNDLSEQFLNFVHVLIQSRRLKKLVNINELLKNEWLNEINKDSQNYQNIFKNDFQMLYQMIIDNSKIDNTINVDCDKLFNKDKNGSVSLFNNIHNYNNNPNNYSGYCNFGEIYTNPIKYEQRQYGIFNDIHEYLSGNQLGSKYESNNSNYNSDFIYPKNYSSYYQYKEAEYSKKHNINIYIGNKQTITNPFIDNKQYSYLFDNNTFEKNDENNYNNEINFFKKLKDYNNYLEKI